MFDKYDTNKSGQLEKGQLIELLRRVSPEVELSEADEAYVLELCDSRIKSEPCRLGSEHPLARPCASLARAWRRWAARYSQTEAQPLGARQALERDAAESSLVSMPLPI